MLLWVIKFQFRAEHVYVELLRPLFSPILPQVDFLIETLYVVPLNAFVLENCSINLIKMPLAWHMLTLQRGRNSLRKQCGTAQISRHRATRAQWQQVPECVYAVDAARHVLSVIYVCRFWVKDLKKRRDGESEDHLSASACCSASTGVTQNI